MRASVVFVLAAALAWPVAAPAREPTLRSAQPFHGHVAVVFSLGDLVAPALVEVATRAVRSPTGSFLPQNVKLRERIAAKPDPATGIVHFRTRGVLRPGTYYVGVSAIAGDATSCTPHYARCNERWSNVLRVVLRKPDAHA